MRIGIRSIGSFFGLGNSEKGVARTKLLAGVAVVLLLASLVTIAVRAAEELPWAADVVATITTDKKRYYVGETMYISGSGFGSGSAINFSVVIPDKSVEYPAGVTADSSGSFLNAPYTPTNALPGRYRITATDGTASATTATTEADAIKVDFLQCANQNPTLGECDWINSILQSSNAKYFEGMATLQRLTFDQIPAAPGGTPNHHVLTFTIDAQKAGIHAYDFLTTWDSAVAAAQQIDLAETLMPTGLLFANRPASAATATAACDNPSNPQASLQDVCRALRALTNPIANIRTATMPTMTDPSSGGNVADKIAKFQTHFGDTAGVRLFGNAAITAATLTFTGYDPAASDQAAHFTLSWDSASTQMEIEFAAHIAASQDLPGGIGPTTIPGYGTGHGASSISGGPYHVSIQPPDGLDGSSLGSQDNPLKGADILIPAVVPVITTQVQNASNVNITGQTVLVGTVVHDHATVDSGSVNNLIPAGSTFTFHRFTNGTCAGTPDNNQTGVAVPSGAQTGSADSSTFTPVAGSYSYLVDFISGNTAIVQSKAGNPATDCEPFTIEKLTPTLATDIHSDAHAVITSATAGATVHDRATIGGGLTPSGTVTFTFYTAQSNCGGASVPAGTNIALVSGVAHPSTDQGPLSVGSYSFKAHYNGDANNNEVDSPCEPLAIGRCSGAAGDGVGSAATGDGHPQRQRGRGGVGSGRHGGA